MTKPLNNALCIVRSYNGIEYFWSVIDTLYHFTQGKDYVACGNSTSKKDSQANAAKDFINYLLRTGEMLPNEVPADAGLDQRYHSNIHKKTGWWVRFAYKLGRWVIPNVGGLNKI